jgi:hypothetical protein
MRTGATRRWSIVVPSAVAIAALLAGPRSAEALTIKPTYDSSITSLPYAASVENAFSAAVAVFQNALTNPITVNIAVSWGRVDGQTLPSNALGASVDPLYGYYSLTQVKAYLAASSTSADDATAVSHLPISMPAGTNDYVIPSAEAKALNLVAGNGTGTDGYIGFSGGASNYTFSGSTIAPGTYDFQAVAEHEIDEVLGRISGANSTSPSFATPFDLFRYSAPNAPSFSYSALAYFSIDGGNTNLGQFNNSSSGGDRNDWAYTSPTANDAQLAFAPSGTKLALTNRDIVGLDVIGYSTVVGTTGSAGVLNSPTLLSTPAVFSPVPEPSSASLLVAAGAALAFTRARRRGRFAGPTTLLHP